MRVPEVLFEAVGPLCAGRRRVMTGISESESPERLLREALVRVRVATGISDPDTVPRCLRDDE